MLEALLDRFGDGTVLAMAGAMVGVLFGAMAQHSRFCLRSASVEVAERQLGPKLYIWLIAFGAAVFSVQAMIAIEWLDVSDTRQLAAAGSLSGAIIGGLLFGSGMILARGCASRLLVLSATGNLRAIITGLVLTLAAQASLRGALAPAREALASLWLVEGGTGRSLLAQLGLSSDVAAILSGAAACAHSCAAKTHGVDTSSCGGGCGLGRGFGLDGDLQHCTGLV